MKRTASADAGGPAPKQYRASTSLSAGQNETLVGSGSALTSPLPAGCQGVHLKQEEQQQQQEQHQGGLVTLQTKPEHDSAAPVSVNATAGGSAAAASGGSRQGAGGVAAAVHVKVEQPAAAPQMAPASAAERNSSHATHLPGAAAAAAAQAAAGGLSLPQLRALLTQAGAGQQEVKELMRPVRYLAKLLHGQDADLNTLQVSAVLPQLEVLVQHIQQRVSGNVAGKSVLPPDNAARHAACLLRVLSLPGVEAAIGGQQQVQQLTGVLRAAQQQWLLASTDGSPAQAPAAGSHPAAAATAATEAAGEGEEAAAGRHTGAAAGAAAGLTVAALQDALAAESVVLTSQKRSCNVTNKLLQLVHGPDADPATTQVAPLLQQWPVLHTYMQQRIGRQLPGEPPLQASTARLYTQALLVVLALPQVRAQLGQQELQQLQQRMQADLAVFKGGAAAEPGEEGPGGQGHSATLCGAGGSDSAGSGDSSDGSSSDGTSSSDAEDSSDAEEDSSSEDEDYVVPSAPASSAGAAGAAAAAAHQRQQQRVKRRQPLRGSERGSRSSSSSLQAGSQQEQQGLTLQQLEAGMQHKHDKGDLMKRLTSLRIFARLLHGPDFDAAAVMPFRDLLHSWDVLEQHLLRRLQSRGSPWEPQLALGTTIWYVNLILGWLQEPLVQEQLSDEELQQLRDKARALRAALTQAAPKDSKGASKQLTVQTRQDSSGGGQHQQPPTPAQKQAAKRPRRAAAAAADAAIRAAAAAAAALTGVVAAANASPPRGAAVSAWPAPGKAKAGAAQPSPPAAAAAAAAAAQQPAGRPATPTVVPPRTAPAAAADAGGVSADLQRGLAKARTAAPAVASESDLIAATRQLLQLYTSKLQPSLDEKVAFRAATQALSRLAADDIRLARFWADYDWVLVLAEDSDSQPEHFRDAFDTLLKNASSSSGCA